MFVRKPKIVNGWSVTKNPNKFGEDIILSLGSFKKDKILKYTIKDKVMIRLDREAARRLCNAIMDYINE